MTGKAMPLAVTGGAVLLLWSGLRGKSWSTVLRDVIGGHSPATATTAYKIAPGTPSSLVPRFVGGVEVNPPPPNAATVVALKAFARTLMIRHGWAGQWKSFDALEMSEAGWNPRALNPSSGAWGLAQALGHGTPATDTGNGHNQYGNFGTPVAICRMANNGKGSAQLIWMFNYLKKYNGPDGAWAFHRANNSY
jgi:hypothetical protein